MCELYLMTSFDNGMSAPIFVQSHFHQQVKTPLPDNFNVLSLVS